MFPLAGQLGPLSLRRQSAATDAYLAAVLADTPLGFWRLEEATGTFADLGSGGNAGTLNGSGITRGITGRRGLAISSDGTGGCVSFGTALNGWANNRTVCSIECWVNFTSNTNNKGVCGTWWASDNMSVRTATGGLIRMSFRNAAAVNTAALNNGAWHHIVGVYDAVTAKNGTLYVDGQPYATTGSITTATPNTAADPFNLLNINNLTTNTYAAPVALDEVAIYTTALSAARVLAHYNAGIA